MAMEKGKKSASEISIADPQLTITPGDPNRHKTGSGGNGKPKGK
jgi:hypothetical protein